MPRVGDSISQQDNPRNKATGLGQDMLLLGYKADGMRPWRNNVTKFGFSFFEVTLHLELNFQSVVLSLSSLVGYLFWFPFSNQL